MLCAQILPEPLHLQQFRARLQTNDSRELRQNLAMRVNKVWDIFMRNIARNFALLASLLALALGASTTLSSAPANAYGTRHAFCIQGNEYPGLSGCTYDTYAQCLASASGRALSCIANPYFAGESDDPYAYQNRGRPFPQGYIPYPPNPYPDLYR